LGTGAFIVGEREGDVANSFQLPGYVRWDAAAAYKWNIGPTQLTSQFNVRNILDQRYFTGADTYDGGPRDYGNIPGEPLSFLGSIRVDF
jgi:iron complex outermembrane receptor protein